MKHLKMDSVASPISEQMPPEGGVVIERNEHIKDLKQAAPNSKDRGMQKQAVSGHIAPLARKDIPQKKDRMDPLKIDMSKTIVAPPTSAQLSLQCIECHIIFSDMKSKERHLKHSHPAEYEQCMLGDALFACYVCDRHFTCSSELMAHQRTHTEKHPFKCPICGDSFGRSSELTLHKKIHFGTHGYTCSECGKPCKTLTLLKYHQRTHTGERPYVCKDCGKRFSMSKTLQKHRVIHSQGEMEGVNDGTILSNPATSKACKPFACSLCNATFKSAKTRLQHMKHKHPHSGERMHNSTIPDGEPLKEGSLTESQIKTCETTEALENMVMFEQGQTLQVMETLGQEQMQQLAAFIETLGHDESVRQVQIVVPEQLQGEPEQSQEQNCSAGPELAQQQMVTVDSGQLEHLKETELEQLQGSAKETELEQAELQMETLEIQFTQAHVETMIEAPVEGHKEGLQLEQIKLMESKQVDVQANQMEETQRQEQNERLEQEVMGELELRHTVQCDESHGEMDLAIVGPDQGQVREQAGTQQKKSNQQAEAQQQKEDELPSQSSDEVQKLSEKTQFIQEETSAKIGQQNQKSKCLSKVIKETEQNKCDNSEEYPVILLCNENIHSSPFPTVNHDVPLEEQVVESVNEEQEAQLKNPLLISQPVNHSQSLQPETAKPKRTLQEKELTHHVEKQSKEKYIKRSKRGHLVVRFVAPERGRKSKPKPLELSKRQQKDDKEEVVPVAVKKIQLKGKRGKEKIIKKRESNKKHSQPLLQEIDLQVQNGVVKTSEQVRQVQSRRELRQSQKTVAKKELRQIQKDVGEKGTKRKRRQEQFEETHKKRREEISHMQLKYQEQMGAGKKLKIPQKKKEQKGKSGSSQNQEQLKKSLLLLKGHKQPQLKVHKLDPQKSPTGALKTKKIMPQRKQQRQTTKPKQDQQEDMLVTPLPDQSLSSSSSLKKSRAPRKRKPSALGIPQGAFRSQPQLALRCEYCGETFSEVVALEEHMAALCSSVTGPCQGNATISSLSDIPQAGEERSVQTFSDKEVLGVHSNNYGIQTSTDWDMEVEMGEIGLGERVSFPALNPSPSLPHAPTCLEGEVQRGGEENGQLNVDSNIVTEAEVSLSLVKIQVTHDQHTVTTDKAQMEGEEQKPEFQKSNKEASDCIYLVDSGTVCQRVEEIKEELLLEVDMVTVGDESMENHLDTQDDNSLELVSSSQTTKVSTKSTSPPITSNTSTVSCAPDCSEVKQEEEEIEVQRKENCGKRINSERRKLTVTQKCGQRSKVQDDSTKETETEMGKDGCQVILEVHSITDGCHIKEEDQVEFLNQSHKLSSLEESSDEQLVFELDSVTTSVEVLKAEHSLEEEPEKGPSSCQSPCVLLERIFRGRERDGEDLEHCQVEIRNGKRMVSPIFSKFFGTSLRNQDVIFTLGFTYFSAQTEDTEESVGNEQERREQTPIDYFRQYLDWDTWEEIVTCNTGWPDFPTTVTAKEVAQFVGIHIAMGTLKFPDMRLYWQDLTRVPLVADSMPASRFFQLACKLSETGSSSSHHGTTHKTNTTENIPEIKKCNGSTDPLWRVRVLLERVRAGCLALNREGNYGIDEYPIHLGRSIRRKSFSNCPPTLNCAVLVGAGGFILDFNLNVDDSRKEDMVEKMVPRNKENREGAVFLCKEELATPVVVEHLLSAGVRSAARVGEVSGGMGNEFVSSDGKLTLFRCAQGFVLSTLRKRPSSKLSIVEEFERAQKVVQLNRELLGLYRTPLSASSPTCWPQSVLWHLTDMALVNSWLQYRVDHQQLKEPMKLMTFRLEVAKALILSNASDSPSSTPPPPPAPLPNQDSILSPSPTPYPTAHTPDDIFRYDGLGHWPEQVSQGEGGKCRFGGCDRTSQVRCLKCCVFLCISQNNNCFLKFHSKEKE
uniref:Uncharacterized LOC111854836 n=1 Tax=Paramormyrops kingsleyae TaxID=1676925 RepID=A0A3B3QU53_9TELE